MQPRFARLVVVPLATLVLFAAAGCGGITPTPGPNPGPNPHTGSSLPPMAPLPLVQTTWPVRTREHVDLWLHGYALISTDTTLVPYFSRGYRDRLMALRRARNVTSQLDANRGQLLSRIAVQPALATTGQFLPLYFSSWEQMLQVIDLFIRDGGNPGATNDQTTRTYFGILASVFPTGPDREWLRQFSAAVDDESRRFYHDYWTSESRLHASVVSRTDTLWQRQWRPALQRFLNNTQQQNGELYLSLPLGGEGRTVHFGKQDNAVAGPMPDSRADADAVLYVMAHEIAGAVASAAIADNTTPADQRAGLTSRYEQAAAVRAGALLLERTIPTAVPGYMRYYLQASGRPAPIDARAAFLAAFSLPDSIRDALARQFDVILGGI